MDRSEKIGMRLRERLDAQHVEVHDDSAAHRGHRGAAGGGGHYAVVVVSERFSGLDRVARHRAIYEALAEMIPKEIHALSATALTPPEWRAQHGHAGDDP
jgi:BolA protein